MVEECDLLRRWPGHDERSGAVKPRGSEAPEGLPAGSTALLVTREAMDKHYCITFSYVLRSMQRYGVTAQQVSLVLFEAKDWSATDPANNVIGNKEYNPLDDYWTARPDGVRVAVVGTDAVKEVQYQLQQQEQKNSSESHISVRVEHDRGPWNDFLAGTYFRVSTIIIRVINGIINLCALAIGVQITFRLGFVRGWFRIIVLIQVILVGFANMFCHLRFPTNNAQLTFMYAMWLTGNTIYSWIVVKWGRFLYHIDDRQRITYYVFVVACVINAVFFDAAMAVCIAGIYADVLHLAKVGYYLYTTVGSFLFLFEAVVVLYACWLYIRYLRALDCSDAVFEMLVSEAVSMGLFFFGKALLTVACVLCAVNAIGTVLRFEAMCMTYHVGIIMVLGGIIWMMGLYLDPKHDATKQGTEQGTNERSHLDNTQHSHQIPSEHYSERHVKHNNLDSGFAHSINAHQSTAYGSSASHGANKLPSLAEYYDENDRHGDRFGFGSPTLGSNHSRS
ncbi:hypothetical protein GQ42DRAFT_162893, partial [Ramicandelaber brevisporus]